MADKIIQWHPGFAAAINLEFAANRQDLIYEREYNLNTKPLVIDLLVIKKKEEVQMENKVPFPPQIIVTKELDTKYHTWLKTETLDKNRKYSYKYRILL